jgi:hypothetical protein
MKKVGIAIGALILALAAFAMARTAPDATKLPKCSGQLCQKAGCSPDVLCARGAAVVSCAEVCGGH